MKKFILLSMSLLSFSAFSQNLDQAVHVKTIEIERPSTISGSNIICLGSGWENINEKIAMRLERISGDNPGLFKDLDSEKTNCFDVADVPAKSAKNLDDLIALIDTSAKENLYTTINSDGSLVVEQEKKDLFSDNKIAPLKYEADSLGIKLLRAEALVFPLQAATMGIFAALPSSISNWDAEKWKVLDKNLVRAWTTPPVMDKDAWYVNGVMHPISGATYYSALRSQGGTRLQSFIYATIQSTVWEYIIESIVEQPSIQDLILTPIVGSVVGELTHLATMRMRRNGFTTLEKVVVTIINPAYVIMNGYKVGNE